VNAVLAAPMVVPLAARWVQLWFPVSWAEPAEIGPRARGARRREVRALVRRAQRPTQQSFSLPGPRKCSTDARARTIPFEKIGVRPGRAEDLRTRDLFEVDIEQLRPRTRADCLDGPRPCPWFRCRYHLAFDWNPERPLVIKENFPHLRILSDPEGPGLDMLEAKLGTCVLDVCDKMNDGTGEANLGGLLALRMAALSGEPLGVTPGMSIKRTGKYLNISVERARQLASLAIQEMRVKLRRENP
jgi:hypothetical protein